MLKNKKMKVFAICLSAVLVVGVFVGAAFAGQEEEVIEEIKRDIVVDTISPVIGNIVVVGEYIGTMEPNQQVAVHPKVAGEVLAVHYGVGEYVEAGAVLFEIDSSALETSISQTQAAVASAQAKANQNLIAAKSNLEIFDVNVEEGHDNTLRSAQNAIDGAKQAKSNAEIAVETAESRLSAAHISLSTARRSLREFQDDGTLPIALASMMQMQGMFDDQIEDQLRDGVRQAQLGVEQAQLGVEQAKVALEAAELNIEKANDGYLTAEVMVETQRINIENQVEMARLNTNFNDQHIAIGKLQSDLDNFKGIAPISGVIERRNIEPFNIAAPQAPAFVISDKDSMTVTFKIPRNSHAHMNPGDKVELEDRGSIYTGTITEVSTGVDSSGLFTVKANIPNPPDNLYTGASVKIFARSQKAESVMTLPLGAIFYENGLPYVFIAEDGLAKKVQIEVGIFDNQNIHVISGITLSDQIISTWSSRLSDGVEIVLASEVADDVGSDEIEDISDYETDTAFVLKHDKDDHVLANDLSDETAESGNQEDEKVLLDDEEDGE